MHTNVEAEVTESVLQAMRDREREWRERKAPGAIPITQEQIDKTVTYWAKVFSPERESGKAASGQVVMTRRTGEEMNYETARRKVWAILQMRAAHIETLEGRPFAWQFDESSITNLRNLTKYFINDASCALPLTKGLFVYGSNGTGKTEIMQAMEKFCRQNSLSKTFAFCSLSEIHVRAKAEKEYDPITPNVQYDRCFDELGRYIGPITRYGDLLDINEAIIEQRYERKSRYGQITHFIANATTNELAEAFSPVVFDRLRSMCTGVYFSGDSKR